MIPKKCLPGVLLIALSVPADAAVRLVPTEYPTIQEAVNAADAGDEVVLEPGTYNETVVIPGIALTLRSVGNNPAGTVLDGTGLEEFTPFLSLEGNPAGMRTIRGLTFRHCGPAVSIATEAESGHVIENCVFEENGPVSPVRGQGAWVEVLDCEFINNEAYLFGGGVTLSGGGRIIGNVFRGNHAVPYQTSTLTQGGAVYLISQAVHAGSAVEIRNNVFEGNSCTDYGGAVHIGPNHTAMVTGNLFVENSAGVCAGGIYIGYNTQYQVTIEENIFVDNASLYAGAIGVDESRDSIVRKNTIIGSKEGEGIRLAGSQLCVVEGNLVVFGETVGINWAGGSTGTQSCNNVYGNPVNVSGGPATTTNTFLDPQFCDFASGDYRLRPESPCLPENNVCSTVIGALGACELTPVEPSTWGGLKHRYIGGAGGNR